ncbi:MAG: transketolase [Thermoprotei archaeon]|jgi:transketolase
MSQSALLSDLESLKLQQIAYKIRRHAIDMIYNAKSGHPGGALSLAEVLSVLYFKQMRVDPKDPSWPDRDRLVLSKGHASAALYAALAMRGYFPLEELLTFRKINSRLQGHPYITTPGVEITTGSLGQGFSNAVGIALAGVLDRRDYRVYAIVSDGECEEGSTWESALFASSHHLSNLTAIVDFNGFQLDGKLLLDLSRLGDMWRAFGWNVMDIDGHDVTQINSAIEAAKMEKRLPSVIIARTVKGKGVSYMENNDHYHGTPPENEEKYAQAIRELDSTISMLDKRIAALAGSS